MKKYTAKGNHISIKDYEDKEKIEECLKGGCEYEFSL